MENIDKMEKMENGCKGVGAKESDWILGGGGTDAIELAPIVDDTIITANQYSLLGGKLRMFCTGFNPMMSICSIDNFQPDNNFREDYRLYAQEEFGYEEGVGNRASTGVDCARSYRNSLFPEKSMVSFRVKLLSMQASLVMDKGYGLSVSYRGDSQYNDDYQYNNVLNGDSFGFTYGHCTNLYDHDTIHDSAKGRPYNIYRLASDLETLINNEVFYSMSYIMVADPDNKIAQDQKRFEDEYQKGIDLGITTIPYEDADYQLSKRESVVQCSRVESDLLKRIEVLEDKLGILFPNE